MHLVLLEKSHRRKRKSTKLEELRRREESHKCKTGETGEGAEGQWGQGCSRWQGLLAAELRRGGSLHVQVLVAPPASVLDQFLCGTSVPGAPSPPRAEACAQVKQEEFIH